MGEARIDGRPRVTQSVNHEGEKQEREEYVKIGRGIFTNVTLSCSRLNEERRADDIRGAREERAGRYHLFGETGARPRQHRKGGADRLLVLQLNVVQHVGDREGVRAVALAGRHQSPRVDHENAVDIQSRRVLREGDREREKQSK